MKKVVGEITSAKKDFVEHTGEEIFLYSLKNDEKSYYFGSYSDLCLTQGALVSVELKIFNYIARSDAYPMDSRPKSYRSREEKIVWKGISGLNVLEKKLG